MQATAAFFWHQYDAGGEGFLSQTVMWDETRVHHLEPGPKQQSMEWPNNIPKDEEIQEYTTAGKIMVRVF